MHLLLLEEYAKVLVSLRPTAINKEAPLNEAASSNFLRKGLMVLTRLVCNSFIPARSYQSAIGDLQLERFEIGGK